MPDWPAMLDTVGQALSYGLLRVILPLILIAVLAIVALRLVAVAAAAIDKRVIDPVQDDDRRARLQTLRKASKSTAQMVIAAIAVLIGLGTIGVDIGPALAAAGIFGLAISLGAQTLIKDIIGGLTILLEDEYRVGDAIRIGSVIGDVERITLRRTDLRDAEGRLFMVPNGEVRTVANETRDWARALVELNFSFDADISRAVAVLDGALARAAADPRVKPHLLDAPEIFGWNQLNDWSVVVRLRAKVTAGKQAEVARVMRQAALEALDEAGMAVARSPLREGTPWTS